MLDEQNVKSGVDFKMFAMEIHIIYLGINLMEGTLIVLCLAGKNTLSIEHVNRLFRAIVECVSAWGAN